MRDYVVVVLSRSRIREFRNLVVAARLFTRTDLNWISEENPSPLPEQRSWAFKLDRANHRRPGRFKRLRDSGKLRGFLERWRQL